jgi:hypothetical protein
MGPLPYVAEGSSECLSEKINTNGVIAGIKICIQYEYLSSNMKVLRSLIV